MNFHREDFPKQIIAANDLLNIPSLELRELYHYWHLKKADRDMPSRKDICPSEITSFLPKILLLDVEKKPLRFKFRLVGTEAVMAMGRDVTGAYLNEFRPPPQVLKRLMRLLENKIPYYATSELGWMSRDFQKYDIIGLPLGNDQEEVSMILCGVKPFFKKENIA